MIIFTACLVAPATTVLGIFVIAAVTTFWVFFCRPPAGMMWSFIMLALAMFLPYFLLVPFIRPDVPGGAATWAHALVVPWGIFLHGSAGMLISIATISTLSASDLRQGLLRLPVPEMAAVILLQIVHQTATLVYETRRIAAAISVRGAAGGGLTTLRMLFSFPRVWLPRIIVHAERVATAMEFRGYCDADLGSFGYSQMRWTDGIVLALVLGSLGIAVAARWWGAA
ncbi:MAG: energy-coupling factor transporter transmembrane component T [bacterium]|nr:energy-coupling factor transporter transmembrane component T [bacterium]